MNSLSSKRRTAVTEVLLLLFLVSSVLAQAPSQTWTPAASCTNGLPTPAASNGTYTDAFGATWAVQCGQDSTGFSYDQYEGTNGHGIYSCFLGCDNRPGCTSFMYQGTVAGANTGAGRCYYKFSSGTYYSNSTVYASSHLLSNGSPNKPCPYYNLTTFTDSNGIYYQVYCGMDSGGGAIIGARTTSDGMASCMTQCDNTAGCNSFSYAYTGSEPAEGAANVNGGCYLKSGTVTTNVNPSIGVAIRVASPLPSPSSTSTSSVSSSSASSVSSATSVSTTSSIASVSTTSTSSTSTRASPTTSSASSASSSASACSGCNCAPVPSAPSCPSSDQQSFLDPCGQNYTVYCGSDTSPGSVSQGTANSISACMQLCDNYANCKAATLQGTTCYLKTSFTSVVSSSNSQLIGLVRYIPPNPNYAVPPLAPCQNCSTGCGSALPAGLTPNGASVAFNFTNPSDGLVRNYLVHIPKFYDPNRASPVIFGFHGNGDTATNIESQTGMSAADLNPYGIAVYVNGYGRGYQSNPAWAPGGTYSYVDDRGFMNALITNITQSFCVDTGRIFAVGHSNGGGFTGVLACDPVLSVKIAAFAANSGAFYTSFTTGDPLTIEPVNTPVQALCQPGRNNVPYIEFHGTADTQILYMGDTTHNGRILPSLPRWSTAWSVREGFGPYNLSTITTGNSVKYEFGGGNGQQGIITHYQLPGWIHGWPTVAGGAPMDIRQPIMDFFYRWTDPNRAPLFDNVSRLTATTTTTTTSTSSSSSIFSTTVTTTTTSTSSSSRSTSSSASSTSTSQSSSSAQSSSSSMSTSTSMPSSSSSSTRTSSVQSSSSSSSAVYTRPSYACPGANGQMFTDSLGIQYMIACSVDTTGGNYGMFDVTSSGSFNDCFSQCSNNYQTTTNCTSFTYYSGSSANGIGPGTCFLKNLSPVSFTLADSNHVGAIRMQYYQAGSYDPMANAVTTTTSSSSSLSSSAAQSSSASSSQNSAAGGASSSSSRQTTTMSSSSSSSSALAAMSSTASSLMLTATSSSGSASSPSASAAVCRNNTLFTDANNVNYTLYCDADTDNSGGGVFATQAFNDGDYTTCANACDANARCGAWVWMPFVNPGGTCYLKPLPQGLTAGNSGYVVGLKVTSSLGASSSAMASRTSASPTASATLRPPQCPDANGTTYADPMGNQYMVLCDMDTSPGNFFTTMEADFGTCIDLCHSQTQQQCIAVTYALGACYFKSQFFGYSPNQGTEAAVLMSMFGGSSSSSVDPHSHYTTTIWSTTSTAAASSASDQADHTTITLAQSSASSSISSTSTLPSCGAQATSSSSSNHSVCADAYGNTFNVTTGRAYTGTITVRAVKPNFPSCLQACDTTPGCIAVNYIGQECQLLSEVTGTTTVSGGGGVAATRPADVATVYTAPPSSVMASTSAPASGGASSSMTGAGPASPAGSSTMSMTGQPGPVGSGDRTLITANTRTRSRHSHMGHASDTAASESASGGGAGPVSGGGYTGITSGVTGSEAPGGHTRTRSGHSNHHPSVTPSGISAPVCPDHDGEQYMNAGGSMYNIQCNSTYSGAVIPPSNSTAPMHKRQSVVTNVGSCMAECDQVSACVAIVLDCSGKCTLLGSVTGSIDGGVCGVAAMKIAGPNTTGTGGVVTVSVCAGRRTGTATLLTTATLTTCPANAHCTAAAGRWLANDLTGQEGEEEEVQYWR